MISFKDWIIQQESSASTRARSAAANGLVPPQTVGSVHGHSTARPWEVEQLSKFFKKKKRKGKKKFGATHNKKKVTPVNKNTQIDSWLKEVDSLKSAFSRLRDVMEKRKKDLKDPKKNA